MTLAAILGLGSGLVAIARPIMARAALGDITTFAGGGSGGDGGPATAASLGGPFGVAADSNGNVYIADGFRNVVRKVDSSGIISTLAGTTGSSGYSGDGGPATAALLNFPTGVAVDGSGNVLICDNGNNRVREVESSTGIITTVGGTGTAGYSGDGGPVLSAEFSGPFSIVTLVGGGFLVSDNNNDVVRKVDAGGIITTFAGNSSFGYAGDGGPATSAELSGPVGLAVDPAGDVFIADEFNNVVRKVDATGTITTVAGIGVTGYSGDGGPATGAQFDNPSGVAYNAGDLFVADAGNNVVRMINAVGIVSTIAGNGSGGFSGDGGPAIAAQLRRPVDLSIDSNANMFIADLFNNRVREISRGPDLLELANGAPVAVASGQPFVVTLTVGNPGGVGTATGVTISDTLPAGLTFPSTGASSTQGTCNVTGTTATCGLGSLTVQAVATVTLSVVASGSPNVVTNVATVTADQTDPAAADNTAARTTLVDAADLSLATTASPNPAIAGQVLTYASTVRNAGPAVATGVVMTDTLPSQGVAFTSATATQGACNQGSGTVTCALGTLAVGGTATVNVRVVPATNAVSLSNSTAVAGVQQDQNPVNNAATVQTNVVLGVAVQLLKPQNTPLYPGQEVLSSDGIAGGTDGNIWFHRLFPNRGEYGSMVGRVTPAGVFQPAYSSDASFVSGMVQGPDGNVWFAETGFSGDPGGQSIGRITAQGKVTLFPMPCGLPNCTGGRLTVGPDGAIWFVTHGIDGTAGVGRIDVKTGVVSFFPTGADVNGLAAGADGNLWYVSRLGLGRLTPGGANTVFSVPGLGTCGMSGVVTGPDHLLWVALGCGLVAAVNVQGSSPSLVSQFTLPGSPGFMTRGPDAVYISLRSSIGRVTTAGVTFYDLGGGRFPGPITQGPDGNIWFTDFINSQAAIGHITPLAKDSGLPVIGKPNQTDAGGKDPSLVNTTNPAGRTPKPPPVAGTTQCPDDVTPASGTVFKGDVIVNDNGVTCFLNQVTINGNLHVSAGAFADLSFSTVNGSVTVDTGGQVDIRGSHVTGGVTANGGSFLTVFSSKVDGSLTSNPSQYGVAMICGTIIQGNLTDSGATDTTFPSVIGDPTGPIPCAANNIAGTLTLSGNSEQILVHGNNVTGAIVVTNNPSTAAFDLRNNNAASLSCSGNAVAPTGGGNHGAKSGQCAKL